MTVEPPLDETAQEKHDDGLTIRENATNEPVGLFEGASPALDWATVSPESSSWIADPDAAAQSGTEAADDHDQRSSNTSIDQDDPSDGFRVIQRPASSAYDQATMTTTFSPEAFSTKPSPDHDRLKDRESQAAEGRQSPQLLAKAPSVYQERSVETASDRGWLQTFLDNSEDRFVSLYRRQALLAGTALGLFALIAGLSVWRGWDTDPGPGVLQTTDGETTTTVEQITSDDPASRPSSSSAPTTPVVSVRRARVPVPTVPAAPSVNETQASEVPPESTEAPAATEPPAAPATAAPTTAAPTTVAAPTTKATVAVTQAPTTAKPLTTASTIKTPTTAKKTTTIAKPTIKTTPTTAKVETTVKATTTIAETTTPTTTKVETSASTGTGGTGGTETSETGAATGTPSGAANLSSAAANAAASGTSTEPANAGSTDDATTFISGQATEPRSR